MTVYVFPGIAPTTVDIDILSNTKTFLSPLSGAAQTAVRAGTRLTFSQRFANLYGQERRIMQAFIARMNGQTHRALIYDHSYGTARGALGGTPVVDGAGQTGTTLNIRGMTPSVTNILRAGDQFSYLNSRGFYELKLVLSDADSDGSGELSLDIAPGIHHSPADGAAIVTTNPAGTFMLASPRTGWSNRPDGNENNPILSDFNIDWIEDIAL
jgi:hypothetical protein